jgi:hypothetical protein
MQSSQDIWLTKLNVLRQRFGHETSFQEFVSKTKTAWLSNVENCDLRIPTLLELSKYSFSFYSNVFQSICSPESRRLPLLRAVLIGQLTYKASRPDELYIRDDTGMIPCVVANGRLSLLHQVIQCNFWVFMAGCGTSEPPYLEIDAVHVTLLSTPKFSFSSLKTANEHNVEVGESLDNIVASVIKKTIFIYHIDFSPEGAISCWYQALARRSSN